MTDRDTFAAAALTGLLYPEVDDEFAMPYIVGRAYLWADAMLRERSRAGQNSSGGTESAAKCTERDSAYHDAAPAARASVESVAPQPTTRGDSDRTDKAAPRPSEGTGDTLVAESATTAEPVAWAVMDGHEFMEFCTDKEEAKCAAGFYGDCPIVPLYRSPTLTDAEREAMERASIAYELLPTEGAQQVSATLRGLLKRTK